jgi:ribosomal protein L34E
MSPGVEQWIHALGRATRNRDIATLDAIHRDPERPYGCARVAETYRDHSAGLAWWNRQRITSKRAEGDSHDCEA